MSENEPTLTCDCAIIGGGVAGLYAGWRLLTDANSSLNSKTVALFEMSTRAGGRLLSWLPFGENEGLRAELGGMRFLRARQDGEQLTGHQLVYHLVNHLKLATKPFLTYDNYEHPELDKGILLLRGKWLNYRRPALGTVKDRYELKDPEELKSPGELLEHVLTIIVQQSVPTGERTDWKEWDRETWDEKKPTMKYEGRPLYQWGFWNLLSTILTYEGYQYLIDSLGYYSLVRNWNAAEALSFIAQDFVAKPDFLTLQKGLGHLPEAMKEKYEEAGGQIHLKHQLIKFERDDEGNFLLFFHYTSPDFAAFHRVVKAKNIILAIPHWSIKQLEMTSAFNLLQNQELRKQINSVTGVPAFKLFLLYDKRWWEEPYPGDIGAGVKHGHSVCDLPIRQTYYFKPDDDAPAKNYKDWGLLMVSYDDGQTVDYWKGMEEASEVKRQGRAELLRKIQEQHLSLFFSGLPGINGEAGISDPSLTLPPNIFKASDLMIKRAVEQVALLHHRNPDDPALWPKIGAYADWSLDPFGGGWNFWRPQVDALNVMETLATKSICEPHEGKVYNAFIVGEAYCGLQGWIEGTLTATEVVLENNFGVKHPHWLSEKYYLGPGHKIPVLA